MTTQNKQKAQEQFINLCQDLMFKIFFSKNEALLLSLAQTFIFHRRVGGDKSKHCLLNKFCAKHWTKVKNKGENWLKDIEIALKNPAVYPKSIGGKGVVLDILATLNTGEVDRFFPNYFTEK